MKWALLAVASQDAPAATGVEVAVEVHDGADAASPLDAAVGLDAAHFWP